MSLYISDLDGTLLNSGGKLSEYSREGINRLIDLGINFTIASARSITSIRKVLDGVRFKLPIIEMNGAFVSDFYSGEHFIINSIKNEITRDLLQIIMKYKYLPFISTFNGEKDCLYYEDILNDGMEWYYRANNDDTRIRQIDCLTRINDKHVISYTTIGSKEKILELKEEISSKYSKELEIHFMENFLHPGSYWLTLHDKDATKDKAIIKLSEKFNLSMENLYVFGDNRNDIPMFKITENSIAVENSNKELKNYAREIIGNNDDDSVIKYILSREKLPP